MTTTECATISSGRSITLASSRARCPRRPKDLEKLVDPRDSSQDLELRARTYLHVNCSVCHVEAGGGNSRMQLALATPREKMELIERARSTTRSASRARCWSLPALRSARSCFIASSQRGRGQMPPLVSNHVDEAAVESLPRVDRRAQARPGLRSRLANGRPASRRSTS